MSLSSHKRAEEKNVEDALRASPRVYGTVAGPGTAERSAEERLADILEGMEDAFCTLDRNWRYTYINRAAETFHGQPREAMLGRAVWDAFPWTPAADGRARYEEAMESGLPATFETAPVRSPDRICEVHLFRYADGLGVQFRDKTDQRRTEEALRTSEARLRLALNAGRLAVWEHDIGTGILHPSPELKVLLGFRPDRNLTTDELRDRYHPDDYEHLHAAAQTALSRGERRFEAEFRFRCGDGVWRWFLLRAEILFEQGLPIRMIGVLLDITDRKTVEHALRESEARLMAVADNIPLTMIYQIVSSRDGSERKFVYVSRSCLRVNGVPSEDVLKDPTLLYKLVLPEYIPLIASAEVEALRNLEPFDVEIALRHAQSGEVRWNRLIWAPRLSSENEVIWDGVQIDVTDRRRAEDAVRASEERLRMLLERMPVGVTLARIPTGDILFQNAMSVDLLGPKTTFMGDEADAGFGAVRRNGAAAYDEQESITRAILRGDVVDRDEVIYHRPDGRIVNLVVNSAPIEGIGNDTLAMSTFYDVTERTRAEEHLRLLINELNHRVKNTLATVQSLAAQSLRDVQLSDEGTALAAKGAFEERIFALARAHDVLTRENWESVSLLDILRQAIAPYRGRVVGNDPFIISGTDIRLPPQTALSLSMAFHELSTNAVKHGALSRPGGCVRITWAERPSGDKPSLAIRWEELGGPPVSPPLCKGKGFGTRLLERGLARELDGKVLLCYEPTGVVCSIDFPLRTNPKPS
ncbi:PAS domain-containing sensor histidine kinase [Microvirga pakistanensis]|uniref:PAS domain-containing sensor histidine kinase n=1 Tax=Microvirga pakistanensis TaxID=1682650 RepID=UPI0010696BB6|nr:PAS domain S-box protein [Microvirga pakistanensis]